MPYAFNPFTGTLDYYVGAAGLVGGVSGDLQFNNAGAFGGIAQSLLAVDRTNLRVGFFNATPSVPVHESHATLTQYTDIGGAVAKSGHVLECTTTDTTATANRLLLSVMVVNLASNPASSKVIAALAGNVSTPTGYATNLSRVSVRGLNATGSHNGTNVLRDIYGGQYNAFNNSTGTVTNVTGVRSVVSNADAAGIITSYKAFEAVDIINAGTFTDTFGFWCGIQTAGTQTNKPWAFYNSDPNSINYFAGATVPRVTDLGTVSSTPYTLTPDTRYCNATQVVHTGAATTITIAADTGISSPQPYNMQSWTLVIQSTNVLTFAWNAVYKGGATPLPTGTTGGGKIDYFAFLRSGLATKWHYTGSSTGF